MDKRTPPHESSHPDDSLIPLLKHEEQRHRDHITAVHAEATRVVEKAKTDAEARIKEASARLPREYEKRLSAAVTELEKTAAVDSQRIEETERSLTEAASSQTEAAVAFVLSKILFPHAAHRGEEQHD